MAAGQGSDWTKKRFLNTNEWFCQESCKLNTIPCICRRGEKIMERKNMWFIFALLSAVFAALTSILAKVGIEGKFKSGNGSPHSGRRGHGVGDGISDKHAGRNF